MQHRFALSGSPVVLNSPYGGGGFGPLGLDARGDT
jgi:hypothetical protein